MAYAGVNIRSNFRLPDFVPYHQELVVYLSPFLRPERDLADSSFGECQEVGSGWFRAWDPSTFTARPGASHRPLSIGLDPPQPNTSEPKAKALECPVKGMYPSLPRLLPNSSRKVPLPHGTGIYPRRVPTFPKLARSETHGTPYGLTKWGGPNVCSAALSLRLRSPVPSSWSGSAAE